MTKVLFRKVLYSFTKNDVIGSFSALCVTLQKVYKASGDQVKSAGYDLRLDAIPFQTAKASREIASDVSLSNSFNHFFSLI